MPDTCRVDGHHRRLAGYTNPVTRANKLEREEDNRWIGEVPALPGVLVYGATAAEARARAQALALRVIADRIEHGEPVPLDPDTLFAAA